MIVVATQKVAVDLFLDFCRCSLSLVESSLVLETADQLILANRVYCGILSYADCPPASIFEI